MGSEIGNHSYTHLINPPTTTSRRTTAGTTPAGSTQVTLDTVPSFAGITVGMVVTGLNIGSELRSPVPQEKRSCREHNGHRGVRQHRDAQFCPGRIRHCNNGVLGDIPAGTTLTFAIPAENTNFLQTRRPVTVQ